jgi:hypothetical protein
MDASSGQKADGPYAISMVERITVVRVNGDLVLTHGRVMKKRGATITDSLSGFALGKFDLIQNGFDRMSWALATFVIIGSFDRSD